MNKTKIIKDTIGKVLEKLDFKYAGKEQKIIWIFSRQVGEVNEQVFIQQHTLLDEEYKIMLYTSALGNSMKEIAAIDETYAGKEYWTVESEEEFVEVMKFFADFINEKCLDILEDMLTEKSDSFETLERKQWFKEHREELIKEYDDKYHILGNGTNYEQIKHMDQILRDNREAEDTLEEQDKVYHFILGMAAILSEIMMKSRGIRINYDSYYVEVELPGWESKKYIRKMPVIHEVANVWVKYHNGYYLNEDRLFGKSRRHISEKVI